MHNSATRWILEIKSYEIKEKRTRNADSQKIWKSPRHPLLLHKKNKKTAYQKKKIFELEAEEKKRKGKIYRIPIRQIDA